ncbi:MAG: glycosyltransferase family 2 protein [Blastocatellia bacterium]
MTQPVSVIMPVYNQERYVADAIDCILKQTHDNFELIVVDDGSTDRTVEIICGFDDPRIRLIRALHGGYITALSRAISEARHDWVARMDSDDLCPADRLEKQMAFLDEHPECVFLTTTYGIVTPNDRFIAPTETSNWQYVEPSGISLGTTMFCDASTVFNRKLALEVGYDDDLRVESPLWYRLLRRGKGVVLDQPLYYIRWRMDSLSRCPGELPDDLNLRVRLKYDPENVVTKTEPSVSPNLKNIKRTIYFNVVANDFKSAREAAYTAWKKFPLNRDAIKLVLVSLGLRRPKVVKGPTGVNFYPAKSPMLAMVEFFNLFPELVVLV